MPANGIWDLIRRLKGGVNFGRIHKTAKAFISFVMPAYLSVRLFAWNNSAPGERIFVKFDISVFFSKNLLRKFEIH